MNVKGASMVRSPAQLADDLAFGTVAERVVRVVWLGQTGFVLKSNAGQVVIDPYLSDSLTKKYANTNKPHVRMSAIALLPEHLTRVDLLLVSHKHSDHFDPETTPKILAASPTARLVLPETLVDHALNMNISRERLIPINAGDVFTQGAWTIRAIPSAHEGLDTDDQGRHLYLGFVVECKTDRGTFRCYHSGDSLAYDGLEERLGPAKFDILFLPINGRDPSRGVPGNMNAREAVSLASKIKTRFLVPHHYDMFTFNTVPIGDFEAAAKALPEGVSPLVLALGTPWDAEVEP